VLTCGAPGPWPSLPVEVSGGRVTTQGLARPVGVPVRVASGVKGVGAEVARLAPEVLLVACCPYRLPPAVISAARVAALNLHPSLLPRYRGPAPLFWQLRAGDPDTGVSLHHLTERLDAGPLVAQAPVPLGDGWSAAEADAALGAAGATLALQALARAASGPLPATVQDEAQVSYQPWPGPEDFEVSTDWSARRAFNFLRGTAGRGEPYTLRAAGTRLRARSALAFWPQVVLGVPVQAGGQVARVQFSPGVVEVALA
jgi:methionyl-tRNA formyltransferase